MAENLSLGLLFVVCSSPTSVRRQKRTTAKGVAIQLSRVVLHLSRAPKAGNGAGKTASPLLARRPVGTASCGRKIPAYSQAKYEAHGCLSREVRVREHDHQFIPGCAGVRACGLLPGRSPPTSLRGVTAPVLDGPM